MKFNLILDKGCIDCLLFDSALVDNKDKILDDNITTSVNNNSPNIEDYLSKALTNINKCLEINGVFVFVSISEPNIVKNLFLKYLKDCTYDYEEFSKEIIINFLLI